SFRVKLKWDLFMVGLIAFVGSFGDIAGRSPLNGTHSSDKPAQNLLGGRALHGLRRNLNLIRIFLWRSVLQGETGDLLRTFVAVMARIACHDLPAAEVVLVDVVHHLNHRASHSFARNIFGELLPVLETLRYVAVHTIQAKGRGKEPHGAH